MKSTNRTAAVLLAVTIALGGCGGGDPQSEAPLDTDYSNLKLAASREGKLVPAGNAEALLHPLRNGVRMSLSSDSSLGIDGLPVPNTAAQVPYSATTIQVEGVDEADVVKYDGQYIYSAFPDVVPARPGMTRNVLKIAKTNPANATLEVATEFTLPGEHGSRSVLYQVRDGDGAAQYIAAISQDFGAWLASRPLVDALVAQPDRTKLQLLDVRDPRNVSLAWEVELDGWLRGTRQIGDTVYVVSSYRSRMTGLVLPADTQEKKEANERRIRRATAQELMPKVRINGGAARQLATTGDCVIAADLRREEAYTDLLVITTLNLTSRAISDVACISTNVNALYVSRDSVYVGGYGLPGTSQGYAFTSLHKFALEPHGVSYRASGVVGGVLPWANASYFMDEQAGRLRIVTTEHSISATPIHRLSILEESANQTLEIVSLLPSPEHPERLGKPGDQLHAVRFHDDRAYVVTARTIDPLYVIDMSDPLEPFIAGELEVPGIATHLQPLATDGNDLLLSVGWQTSGNGAPLGVKVELFDVSDITLPRTLGAHVFGDVGSLSEAVGDPRALTVLTIAGEQTRHRIGLPVHIYEADGSRSRWAYSGFQFLEVSSAGGGSPRLHVEGVLKTDVSSSPGANPPHTEPRRVVMHGDAVYGVSGGTYISNLWDFITSN